jgi:hypothetical protein
MERVDVPWVDDAHHARLAVTGNRTVEEDWIRVVDGDSVDHILRSLGSPCHVWRT